MVNLSISPKTDYVPYTQGLHRVTPQQTQRWRLVQTTQGIFCRKSEFLGSQAPVSSQHTHALLPPWLRVLELNIKAHRSIGPNCHK